MDDCNPADLFGKAKSEQDILNFFANRNRPQEEGGEGVGVGEGSKFSRKESMPEYSYTPSSQQRNLNEKVRLAK